ncbi:MAG: CRISPR-associated endoribonuclease Cas6 [Nitrososphaerales archaeon]
MRVIVKLEALEDCAYEYEYHHHLQGLIYDLIKDSEYSYLHDKKGYKFFCFSNIFPAEDLKKGDKRTLIVSSPDDLFIERLREVFLMNKRNNKKVKVGWMNFAIDNISLLKSRLDGRDHSLITGTPIVVRMQRDRCKEYGITLDKDYDYVYWRKEYPLTAFIKQIEDNLTKKYIEFYNENPNSDVFPLIQMLTFRKQISTRLHFEEGTQIVIGTTWEFYFRGLSDNQIKLLEFGIDAGFGEMNSRGFGFMNIKDK